MKYIHITLITLYGCDVLLMIHNVYLVYKLKFFLGTYCMGVHVVYIGFRTILSVSAILGARGGLRRNPHKEMQCVCSLYKNLVTMLFIVKAGWRKDKLIHR